MELLKSLVYDSEHAAAITALLDSEAEHATGQ